MKTILVLAAVVANGATAPPAAKCAAKPFSLAKPAPVPVAKKPAPAPAKVAAPVKPKVDCKKKRA
jgi:hypothetical protein